MKLVRVEPKSDSGRRSIALPSVTMSAIAAHLRRRDDDRVWAGTRWDESGYLFTTRIGTPLDARNVIRRFHQILKTADLPQLNFHGLRHSVPSLLLAQGVAPRYITDLLGHSQVSFTMQTYAHVLAPVRKEVAAKMDEIMGPKQPEIGVATKPAADPVN